MIRAKKSLGQNFLKSASVVKTITETAQIKKGETVLEVGPGKGILTRALLEAGARVVAVEKDDRLIEFLNQEFAKEKEEGRFTLIHQDILEAGDTIYNLLDTNYKLVANIPYYITGQLLRQFLEAENQPSLMVLMLQKEVAERIVARDAKESILSISVKAYGQPKYVKTVARGNFSPAPNVDSAILLIDRISKNFFTSFPEEKFFELVKKGFAQKRKKLQSNLRCPFEVFHRCGLPENTRAEDLALGEWKCLAENYNPKN